MKEIIIKIPEEIYNSACATNNTWNMRMAGFVCSAIANGKVLPPGHRRLIEVTPRLEAHLSTFQSYTGIDEAPYEYADELIRNADTVVEADEVEE